MRHKLSLVLIFVLFLSLVFLVAGIWRNKFLRKEFHALQSECENFNPPAINTFGGSNLRPGAFPSCLSGRWSKVISRRVLHSAQSILSSAPLFLNATQGTWPEPFQGKQILVFQSLRGIIFVDRLLDRQILVVPWPRSEMVPNHNSSAAPVFDPETKSLYGIIVTGKDRRMNWAYHYSLQTGEMDLRPLKLSKKLSSRADARKIIDKALICRTALGFVRNESGPALYWGCSFARQISGDHRSSVPGMRGGFFLWGLARDGKLSSPEDIRAFTPVAQLGDGEEGADGSIWNSGAGPSVLPDGSFLMATGNGRFEPRNSNFGCSVLRVDRDFKVLGFLFRTFKGGAKECDIADLDLSSSSVASVIVGDKVFSAITGKDGVLKSFDPFSLPGVTNNSAQNAHLTKNWAFGQPSLWFDGAEVQVRAATNLSSFSWVAHAFNVEKDRSLTQLWKREFPGFLPNSNAAVAYHWAYPKHAVFAVPVLAEAGASHSLFYLVDAVTGENIGRVPFSGVSHFSMPISVGHEIYFVNRSRKAFEISTELSFSEGLRRTPLSYPFADWLQSLAHTLYYPGKSR